MTVTTEQPKDIQAGRTVEASSRVTKIALLTGGFDRPYAYGMSRALAGNSVDVDFIGSDDLDGPEMRCTPGINFLNLRGSKNDAGLVTKATRVLGYYGRLLKYASVSEANVFHLLWNNKFQFFDRTLLMLYYKLVGKKIVFTAHNVNAGQRDGNDSILNRLTLRAQYHLSDHIFVHTEQMKAQLEEQFAVEPNRITVIPFGINNSVPNTTLTPQQARENLGLPSDAKVILFFGAIRQYKGIEYLVDAYVQLASTRPDVHLMIAGLPKEDGIEYIDKINTAIRSSPHVSRIHRHLRYVADEHTEIYFKSADVLVLPYSHVFQSGVLFLSYSFGLPVIASDVGSVRDDVIEGTTGYLCEPRNSTDLAKKLDTYFDSALFQNLCERRSQIQAWAEQRHSWDVVASKTCKVYTELQKRF